MGQEIEKEGERHVEQYLSHSAMETFELGKTLGKKLPVPSVVSLFGDLGAGKTTFSKGLIHGISLLSPSMIQSPTFTYLNIYNGEKTVYHFDLYRITDADEFFGMGFDEYFDAKGVCCIEWAERIEAYLPPDSLCIFFTHLEENQRLITLVAQKEREMHDKS